MSSIQYHLERSVAERLIAADAHSPGEAAIHVDLAEMHEQVVAAEVNQSLAPFTQPTAWSSFTGPVLPRSVYLGRKL